MSDGTAKARTPTGLPAEIGMGPLELSDLSLEGKWRRFSDELGVGSSQRGNEYLEWSVSPGETTVLGPKPAGEVVDLTHVRALYRLTGTEARDLLNKICALDLDDSMFPDGAAGRTLVAGVATEVVRDDVGTTPSYLLVPSRSFGRYLHEVILDAGLEFGQDVKPSG